MECFSSDIFQSGPARPVKNCTINRGKIGVPRCPTEEVLFTNMFHIEKEYGTALKSTKEIGIDPYLFGGKV